MDVRDWWRLWSAIVPVLCRHLAVACVDVVSLWSVETGQVVRSIVPEGVSALCQLIVCCACVTECIPCPPACAGVLSVSYSPSGSHLVVGCEKGLLKVYNSSDFKPLFELQGAAHVRVHM